MLKVYLHQISTENSYDHLLHKLPLFICQKITRRKNKQRGQVSLVGYAMLQQALRENTDISSEQLKYQKSGKPYFEQHDWYFSISHSQDWVGVALSDEGDLGLDIEHHRDLALSDNTFAFFSSEEKKSILLAHKPQQKVIEYWSKKEAMIKAVGGQMFDMANYTNIVKDEVVWEGKRYHLHQLGKPPVQYIWLATNFCTDKISIENIFYYKIKKTIGKSYCRI